MTAAKNPTATVRTRRIRGLVSTRLTAAALAVLAAGAAQAATLRHTYRFDTAGLRVESAGAAATLRAAGLGSTWEAGQPAIPFDVVTLLVPQGSRLVGLRARALGEQVVAADVRLGPAAPQSDVDGRVVEPRAARLTATALAAAGRDALQAAAPGRDAYPALLAEPAGGGALHGYQMISVRVFPVRYEAGTRRVVAAERIDLELELAPGGALPLGRARYRPEIEARARRALETRIANRAALDDYSRRLGVRVEKPRGGFQPSDAPSLEGSAVDYVIVTTDALAPTYQTLADWKTQRGVPTVVRTVEWIEANYRHGSDLQETIRTFIQDAYAKWGVQYVALGGDTDLMPARYGYSAYGDPTQSSIPADLYFGCLDGNWNRDGDALWGEAAISASNPGDSTDLHAEVYVGRIPFSTPAKAAAYIGKLTTYENPVHTDYQNKLLLLGEVLFPVDWQPPQAVTVDGGTYSDEMASYITGCVAPTKLYENYTAFPGSSPLTRAATLAEMNTGYGFVNHIGHGYRYNMSCGDRSITNADAFGLTNGDKRFVLYMLNCTATAFDFPCLAEAWLEAPGGAVAVLGSSRSAFAAASRPYNREFFDALYQQGYSHVGETFAQSRLAQTGNAWFDTSDHYTHLLYNFLGDPEMVIHTCTLGSTVATYTDSIGLGTSNVSVHVEVGGLPRQGALVCLQKGTEEYEVGTTDAGGDVVLPVLAESPGTLQVTVSGQNMTTHQGSITVTGAAAAWVHVQSLGVDDDGGGASQGNADGALDAGETLELDLTFANDGALAASGVAGVLRVASPWVTVVDSTYTLGGLAAAGGTAVSTAEVAFTVAPAAPDGSVLPLEFVSTDSVSTWADVVKRVVHAPSMQFVRLAVDDFAPGGNGDGVIQAGETFDLVVRWKNYGSGAADGLVGSLQSGDPDLTILEDTVLVGQAAALQEVTGATRFRLTESVLDENALVLTLTDDQARTLVSNITLRGPAKPATPALSAAGGAGIIAVQWTPSVETDLAGYHVFRAPSASGPWTQVTVDHTVRVAYFRDTGLAPSTSYSYRVTALDQSGNESVPSNVTSINTNPAQIAGWPINLAASSSCPAAVGDVTGDGSKEIVAGNANLYAWNWNGIELRDDDSDPLTWGVLAAEVKTITGAVALAEMDASSPGFEIFVTVWDDSNKAFVVRGDGSFPPNWPRNPDPGLATKGYWAASAAVDVDGDGLAEVFAPAKNGNLYAWHADGTPLGAGAAFKSGFGGFGRCSPSIANLDADPEREIVFGAPNGTLHIWNANGSNFGSFPKSLGTLCLSNTAIGDVNGDGRLDVVMITENDSVYVVDTKLGTRLPGWPKFVSVNSNPISPSPALADFDFDGKLEIVVAHNASPLAVSGVRVYDWQGNLRSGWPKLTGGVSSESSPIVADFSGDGIPDILFGNEGGLLYGWDRDGVALPGFPLTVGDFIRSTPFADDVDGDGGIDLVLSGWDKNVYIWDFPVPFVEAAAQWPTLKHDAARSSYYGHRVDAPTDVGPGDGRPDPARLPQRPVLAQNVPNPFNPTTSIAYGVPAVGGEARVEARLDVFDVQGRLVRQLVRGLHVPGPHQAVWDGRDDRGMRVRSGVYFYRLQAAGASLTRKLVLLQ